MDAAAPEIRKPKVVLDWLRRVWVHRHVAAATFVVSLASMACTAVSSYTSPAMPDLKEGDHVPFRPTDKQTSWLSSVTQLGTMVGALLCGFIADRLGRHRAIMVFAVPLFIGWVIVASSTSFAMMLSGRIITGLFDGLLASTVNVYISEISPTHIRGKLGACESIFSDAGNLYTAILGAYLPWNWLAIASGAILVVMVVLLVFFPETPRWLIVKGYTQEAQDSLRWLWITNNVDKELTSIQQSLVTTHQATPYRNFLRGPLLRPLIISQGLTVLKSLSGSGTIKSYTVQIFTDAGTSMDPNVDTIIIGIVGVCGAIFSALIVEIVGRRALYMLAFLFASLAQLAMGIFFYVQSVDADYAHNSLGWLPLTTLVVFNFAFSWGIGPLLHIVTCEIFPTQARQRASSFVLITQGFTNFLMNKYFLDLKATIGEDGVFFLLGGFCFAGLIFVFIMLPETKGKSLEELQIEWSRRDETTL